MIADVFGVLPLDEHFGKAHGVRLRVDLLPEQTHISGWIVSLDKIVAGGEHTACAAGLIQYGDDFAVIKDIVTAFGKQDVDHQLDNIATGVVIAGLGIFGELTDQLLKDISHLYIIDGARVKVELGKRLDDGEQAVILVHLVDLFTEVQPAFLGYQNFQHIGRETLKINLEIGSDMIRIVHQLRQIKFAGVIELKPGNVLHCFCREVRILFEFCYDRCFGRCQRTFKTADNCHRDDDILILVTAVRSTKFVGDRPDEVHFCRNIDG